MCLIHGYHGSSGSSKLCAVNPGVFADPYHVLLLLLLLAGVCMD
jgi:hypothetical protein